MQQQLSNNRTEGLITFLQKQVSQQEAELRRTRKKLAALLRDSCPGPRLVVDNGPRGLRYESRLETVR